MRLYENCLKCKYYKMKYIKGFGMVHWCAKFVPMRDYSIFRLYFHGWVKCPYFEPKEEGE